MYGKCYCQFSLCILFYFVLQCIKSLYIIPLLFFTLNVSLGTRDRQKIVKVLVLTFNSVI